MQEWDGCCECKMMTSSCKMGEKGTGVFEREMGERQQSKMHCTKQELMSGHL